MILPRWTLHAFEVDSGDVLSKENRNVYMKKNLKKDKRFETEQEERNGDSSTFSREEHAVIGQNSLRIYDTKQVF